MNDKNIPLIDKIKSMPIEEVLEYEEIGARLNRFVNILGISLCLVLFFYPTIWIFFVGVPVILLVSWAGGQIKETLNAIRKLIHEKQ